MTWQDVVVAVGQLFFSLALLPSILGLARKPPIFMCLMTWAALIGFAVAYQSLEMWGATISVSICALGWGILAGQQIGWGSSS